MKTLNYSRQREALMKCLEGRRDHPTADVLFQSLREEDPKISLGHCLSKSQSSHQCWENPQNFLW